MKLEQYIEARNRLKDWLLQAPLTKSEFFSSRLGVPVYFKMECYQHAGSSKWRGVINKLLQMPPEALKKGVVTYSIRNLGMAVALASKKIGFPAEVFIPSCTEEWNADEIRRLGVEPTYKGQAVSLARNEAFKAAEDDGKILIKPADDEDAIVGYGTTALEILDELDSVGTLMVPLGGGGVLSGMADVFRQTPKGRKTWITGVTIESGAAMVASLEAQKILQVRERPSVADSLVGNLDKDNQLTYKMVRELVDENVHVSEDEIINAMRMLYQNEKIIAEGAGVVALAACLSRKSKHVIGPVVIPITGHNIEMNVFTIIMKEAETESILKYFLNANSAKKSPAKTK